ncbi:cytidyltransferase [Vibrio splendidus]|uniref:RraA family protein n=1 Tax=Vibrio splendidus TaxID=29497 RepID=UPI002469813C|nr:cytidyltransferase [Vibrio splendidus]MDH5914542.1 cytidyltransferase [Vibrio splendidus]MDH5943306.1 cytidyltransferase [Vibrio splendidus]MDH5986970.1 cytidyltransferase [Vibrio splendidus]MDH5995055.1 cytidyltransferase [Vibrio splendidus]MDH6007683.1 cytidyltransferase [Vibrio splendidus]
MRVIAFLPAKGSSSRIESKNMKLLDGKPLFLYTLEKLVNSGLFDEVFLDTESQDVIDAASEIECSIMRRDPELASNKTDGNKMFYNEVKHSESDIYVQVLCTSPFINMDTIKSGIEKLKASSEFDSAVLIRKERQYTWSEKGPEYDMNSIPNSVDLGDTIIETMGLYIVKRDAALSLRRRIGNSPYLLEASPLEAIDVNWPEDFQLAELIAAGEREKSRKLLGNIKNHLSSCILSDLLDDLGYPNQVIKGLTPNIDGTKLLGRAKTLKLRKLEDGESYKGIYDALYSYDTIVPNDIILVENETPDFAYFGELNANLAIRSGASGVIVNGMTRDNIEVIGTGLPVFAQGYTCQDVRKRATTESFNKTINLNGIKVEPECLVFADSEGVIIIPKSIEEDVINEVYKRSANEKKILSEIALGADVDSLTKKYGFF